MQQVLSKIKASLEESKNRIESGNHENHDLLPSLLVILVELLEENSEKYDNFLNTQKDLLKADESKRNDAYWDLIKNTNDTKRSIEDMSWDFLHKIENSFAEFQKNFLAKNKINNTIMFILLWLSLLLNVTLIILFIIK